MTDTTWNFPCGPKTSILSEDTTIPTIFNYLWKDITESVVQWTNSREEKKVSIEDVNLFWASEIVMGLNSESSIEDYFKHDSDGIFGNLWMKEHFTAHKWSYLHSHIHIKPNELLKIVCQNCQQLWDPHQKIVIDEGMLKFTGKWKWIQFILNKPNDTGNIWF
jgi:hypothetical protein